MDIRNPRALKDAAAQALGHAPNHRKLILICEGAGAALSLLVSLLNFLLDGRIADTGGLSGIGLRSALSTAQTMLSLAMMVLLPFWQAGYNAAVLRFSREEPAAPDTLLAGFRRFGPVLRMLLLQMLLYTMVAFFCFTVGSTFLSLTPLATPVYNFLLENEEAVLSGVVDEALVAAMTEAMLPLLIGCLVLYLLVLVILSYRLRLASLRIMDEPRCGALQAMAESVRRTRGNCMSLVKLDLSFWWFYLAQGIIMVINYGDLVLPALGVALPLNADIAFFLFYVLALAAQVALFYLFGNRVRTAYAVFYNALQNPPVEMSRQSPPSFL